MQNSSAPRPRAAPAFCGHVAAGPTVPVRLSRMKNVIIMIIRQFLDILLSIIKIESIIETDLVCFYSYQIIHRNTVVEHLVALVLKENILSRIVNLYIIYNKFNKSILAAIPPIMQIVKLT